MHTKIVHYRWRVHALTVLVIIMSLLIIGRAFVLQVLRFPIYKALASNQRNFSKTIIPQRGEIFVKDEQGELYPLAINRRFWKVYTVPAEVSNSEEAALRLASLLDISSEKIKSRLEKKDDPYEPIKDRVSDEEALKVKDLKLEGIYIAPDSWRYYPEEDFASHILGFVGFKDEKKVGQYGIEEYYEEQLAGHAGFLEAERTGSGAWISVGLKSLKPAKDGDDLVLTIDRTIQFLVATELRKLIERFGAQGGTIIVMDPASGEIKAMSSYPSFDPNKYFEVKDIDVFLNPAIQKLFEPGSVFKPIVMAAGLDLGKITPQTTYIDEGLVRIGGRTIHNVDYPEKHGLRTMTQVLEESLNTGAIYAVQLLKKEEFAKYIKDFGLDSPTGVELAGEIGGDTLNLATKRNINYATASFGQGIAMTPLELLTAISTIANGGKMMKPYIIEKFIHPDGTESLMEPKEVAQVISPQAAMKLTAMMVSVVKNGYGRKAGVEGYFVAGKTGTAQVPKEGRYSDETIHSFIGFAPAFDPRFVILIKLDNPQGIRFAADSVTPVFSKMARFLLNYYQIPPTE